MGTRPRKRPNCSEDLTYSSLPPALISPASPYPSHSPLHPPVLRPRLKHGTPAPWDCDLFYVDRAALLSGHRLTDNLLHHILHVYGASDLARDGDVLASLASPNDHIMLLLGPQAEAQGQASGLPDILSVIHVRSGPAGQLGGEGEGLLTMGQRPLSGVEIVRVATHPEVRRMGYGLRAVHMALRYFRGDLIATMEEPHEQDQEEAPQEVRTHSQLQSCKANTTFNSPFFQKVSFKRFHPKS